MSADTINVVRYCQFADIVQLSQYGLVLLPLLAYWSESISPLLSTFHRIKPYGNTPTGILLRGHQMQLGYEKITIFDQYIAVSQK